MRVAHEKLHRQRKLRHRVPEPVPKNSVWGIDTSCVSDASKAQHIVLGIIDHGTRMNVGLRRLERFNAWAFLSCVFAAIAQFGKPATIKTDNHQVFRSRLVKLVLGWFEIRLIHSRPARPWENGYIERLFGTFKIHLRGYVMQDARHLAQSLPHFQYWYNAARPHQHLGGRTPSQAWHDLDPFTSIPKTAHAFSAWEGRLKGLVLRH